MLPARREKCEGETATGEVGKVFKGNKGLGEKRIPHRNSKKVCIGLPRFRFVSNWSNTRDVDKKGHPLARSLEKLRFNQLGQRALTLACYIDSDGKLGVAVYVCLSYSLQCLTAHCNNYDFNDELGEHDVLTFEQKYPKELAAFVNKYFEYGNYVIGTENGETLDGGYVRKGKKKNKPEVLDQKEGYPIFKGSYEDDSLTKKKALVRAFLNKNYGRYFKLVNPMAVEANNSLPSALASGRETASAPFKALDRTHLKWANAKYWPTDVVVTDPSRMNTPEIDKLLIFW